jgi:O-antigen/teichoic acid export membrane protein
LAYVIAVCAKTVVLIGFLLANGELNLRPNFRFIEPKLRNEMISVAAYSILTGFGSSIVFNIDKILVNQMLGLSATGVYTIAFFFGTLIIIPSRPLLRISGTLIAEAFKHNDLVYIAEIYKKSSINQFIIGAFLFGGIWINIDNVLIILGPEYTEAKWVIFFIGLAFLVDMATGANGIVIAYSKHYRVTLYLILLLVLFVIVSMVFLIPIFNIKGAGIAVFLSIFLNNFLRFIFIFRTYKMQPFTINMLLIPIIFTGAFFIVNSLPQMNLVLNLFLRSIMFSAIYILFIYISGVSSDINNIVIKIIRKIGN